MTPTMEFHFRVLHTKGYTEHFEAHPASTAFPISIAADWSWADQIVPMPSRWPSYSWPGGYEIHYVTRDCGVLCHRCANANLDLTLGDDSQWQIVAEEINYEDQSMFCDDCGSQVKPAYGSDDGDKDDQEQATPGPT